MGYRNKPSTEIFRHIHKYAHMYTSSHRTISKLSYILFLSTAPNPLILSGSNVPFDLLCTPDMMCAKFYDDWSSSYGVKNQQSYFHIYYIVRK